MDSLFSYAPFLVILVAIVFSCIKIMNEYERGVVFRLGNFQGVRGPGLIILIPGIEKLVKVDLRVVTMDVPSQDIITKDNVTLKVNGVVYFKVHRPDQAIIGVENYYHATAEIAQTTLRSIIGQYDLDDILSSRDEINSKLQTILDEVTEAWGIKVTNVELKAIDLPESMQRIMARTAEAERERRAKIISAEGEVAAAEKLAQAAKILATEKESLTLRYLDTMREMSSQKNTNSLFFPLPIDIFNKFLKPNKE